MTSHQASSARSSVREGAGLGSGKHWLAFAAQGAFPLDAELSEDGENEAGTGFAACALSGDAQSACDAREFARTTLGGWAMPAEVTDSVAMIVSELLSNAIRYGLAGPRPLPASSHPVWLGLLRRGTTVLCAVSDPNGEVPVLREPDILAESGRGLHVIDSLSDSWGWTPPDDAGKTVWAAVSSTR